jgi:hypothetical protein
LTANLGCAEAATSSGRRWPDQAVAQPLSEAVRVDVEQLGGDVGIGGGCADVCDQADRADHIHRLGQLVARI